MHLHSGHRASAPSLNRSIQVDERAAECADHADHTQESCVKNEWFPVCRIARLYAAMNACGWRRRGHAILTRRARNNESRNIRPSGPPRQTSA